MPEIILRKIFAGETINTEIKDKDSQGNEIYIHLIETAINFEDDKKRFYIPADRYNW